MSLCITLPPLLLYFPERQSAALAFNVQDCLFMQVGFSRVRYMKKKSCLAVPTVAREQCAKCRAFISLTGNPFFVSYRYSYSFSPLCAFFQGCDIETIFKDPKYTALHVVKCLLCVI